MYCKVTEANMPYSTSKAARLSRVSKTTIHKWIKSGKMSASKLEDGTYAIDESELARVTSHRETVSLGRTATASPKDITTPKAAPLDLSIYKANTIHELKFEAALEAATYERKLLQQQVDQLTVTASEAKDRAEQAEERTDEAIRKYHESIQTLTRLLEDKRPTQSRTRFLGIF